jgi:small subunit ribosomal protein S17
MPKKVAVGIVTSDSMAKTRRVEIPRLVRHPKYGKFVRRSTICYVHDENNDSSVGDKVEIVESPPVSKTKRWRLVRVLEKGRVELAPPPAGQDELEQEGQAADDPAGN